MIFRATYTVESEQTIEIPEQVLSVLASENAEKNKGRIRIEKYIESDYEAFPLDNKDNDQDYEYNCAYRVAYEFFDKDTNEWVSLLDDSMDIATFHGLPEVAQAFARNVFAEINREYPDIDLECGDEVPNAGPIPSWFCAQARNSPVQRVHVGRED